MIEIISQEDVTECEKIEQVLSHLNDAWCSASKALKLLGAGHDKFIKLNSLCADIILLEYGLANEKKELPEAATSRSSRN